MMTTQDGSNGERPNLLLFGVGHSGTSIVVKLLGELGWNLGQVDGFAENIEVRRRNVQLLGGRGIVVAGALKLLAELPAPWVIKDPRFVLTVPQWIPVFSAMPAAGRPTMLFLTREIGKVERSYVAYGEVKDGGPSMYRHTVRQLVKLSQQAYAAWPFQKIHFEFEQIIAATQLFKIDRATRRDSAAAPKPSK